MCVKETARERESEWWGRRMLFCYIWKSFLLGDSARFGLYQLVIAKTKPLRFTPSWLLSKHLEERHKKMKRETKSPSPLSLLLLEGSQRLFCWNGGATWNRSVLVHFLLLLFLHVRIFTQTLKENEILQEIKRVYINTLSCSGSIMWYYNQNMKYWF